MDEIKVTDIPDSAFRTETDILGRPLTQFAVVDGITVMRPAPPKGEMNESQ